VQGERGIYWDLNEAAWVTVDGEPVLPVEQFEDEVAELAVDPEVIEGH
jgi:hypothetical protein